MIEFRNLSLKRERKAVKLSTKKETAQIKSILIEHYKNAKTELVYKNVYELLVCVMLSAQCTDKRVNIITPSLFENYPDINALANANLESLKLLIQSCSFFNNKAVNLIKMAKSVKENFDGEIPLDEEKLVT
ncbi:MAG: endonuclease III, partial [Campylobacteraceae bacterium]|nr:endonuclease III [Campylobacteraceae bacterium]